MKKLVVIIALSLGLGSAYAQKAKEVEVPTAVKESFAKQYPNAKVEKWEKEGALYEAEFRQNKLEMAVTFDARGNLQDIETEIAVSELPKAVTEYVSKNVAGKKIKEASRIANAEGMVFYEVEVDGADYIFDGDGNFVKKEVEENDDDKKKK
jgi:thermostable 8-oxoguanine DNA glycosylase